MYYVWSVWYLPLHKYQKPLINWGGFCCPIFTEVVEILVAEQLGFVTAGEPSANKQSTTI